MKESTEKRYPYPRVHTYRGQVKLISLLLLVLLFTISIYVILELYFYLNESGVGIWSIVSGVYAFILFLFFLGEYYWGIRPLLSTEIQAYKDKLVITNKGKVQEIDFASVRKLTYRFYPYLGGRFTIHYGKKSKFRVTILLERPEYILRALYEFNPDLMDEGEFKKVQRQLIGFDHVVARYHDSLRNYWYIYLSQFLLLPIGSLFAIAFFQGKASELGQSLPYLEHTFFSHLFKVWIFAWISAYIIGELMATNEYKARTAQGDPFEFRRRNLDYEKRIFFIKNFISLPTALVLCVLIGFHNLNVKQTLLVAHDYPLVRLKKREHAVVDKRYTCLNCKFSVTKGDAILLGRGSLFSREYIFAKVLALPGERFFKNKRDDSGRKLAGLEYVILREGEIGVQVGNDQDKQLIKEGRLLGKLIPKKPKEN